MGQIPDYAGIIKAYRKAHKLTQQELAAYLNVKHVTLRAWEQNKAQPPYYLWREISKIFTNE